MEIKTKVPSHMEIELVLAQEELIPDGSHRWEEGGLTPVGCDEEPTIRLANLQPECERAEADKQPQPRGGAGSVSLSCCTAEARKRMVRKLARNPCSLRGEDLFYEDLASSNK